MSSVQDIPFEVTSKPWFGPTKRAKTYLDKRTVLLKPEETLARLSSILGAQGKNLQWVRFIDFEHREKANFRFTIMLVWTYAGLIRQQLYDLAGEIVEATGWYPLPQGERLGSRRKIWSAWKSIEFARQIPSVDIGRELVSVESAAKSGCCLRIRTSQGSILLDSGLPGEVEPEDSDAVVLLSHLHSDHYGGLEARNVSDLPTIMSPATGRLLLSLRRIPGFQFGKRYFVLPPGPDWTFLGGEIEIRSMLVPHAPGSVGYCIRDGSKAVLFSGDFILRSNRHDFTNELLNNISGLDRRTRMVLLDGTMAGRSFGGSVKDVTSEILNTLERKANVVITTIDPEQLVYAYLDLWWAVKESSLRHQVRFVASRKLKPVFETIHAHFIGRNYHELDPFVLNQYRKTLSAWAESRWLFWSDPEDLPATADEQRTIYLFPRGECDSLCAESLENVVLVGVGRVKQESLEALASRLKVEVSGLDTSCWTLHSDSQMVAEITSRVSEDSRVVLFHNFPKRLKKFVRDENLDASFVSHKALDI